MKKYILPLITFGLLIFIFACSSSKDAIDKENISISRLCEIRDSSTSSVTVKTAENTFVRKSICEVNDSSIKLINLDSEEYKILLEKFREDYTAGKVKFDHYPKQPDTLIIPINSIQAISYSLKSTYNYSEDELQISGYGIEIDGRKNELTLGAFAEMQLGNYRPILEFNTTFNSVDKLRISSSALYSLGYAFLGMLIGKAITGEPIDSGGKQKPGNNLIYLIIYTPLLLTNAEHHIFIINPSNSNSDKSFGLSVFGGFRLDIYNSEWIVYSPEAGIQVGHYWGKNDYGGYSNSMDFQIGIEYPYENRFDKFQEPKISAGVKFKFL